MAGLTLTPRKLTALAEGSSSGAALDASLEVNLSTDSDGPASAAELAGITAEHAGNDPGSVVEVGDGDVTRPRGPGSASGHEEDEDEDIDFSIAPNLPNGGMALTTTNIALLTDSRSTHIFCSPLCPPFFRLHSIF